MKKKICCVSFWSYPINPRMRRELGVYVKEGYDVDIICPALPKEHVYKDEPGISVYRTLIQRKRGGIKRYIFEYLAFCLLAFFYVSIFYVRRRYKVMHVFCMPEMLVFSALIPKLFGSKIVMDIQDPTREVFIAKFGLSHPFIIWVIEVVEKITCRLANVILIPNTGFLKIYRQRKIATDKFEIIMNSADEGVFKPLDYKGNDDGHYVLAFYGQITERSGIGFAVRSLQNLAGRIPGIQLKIVGEGEDWDKIEALIDSLGVGPSVQAEKRYLVGQKLMNFIADADVCIVPNPRNPLTEINFPTRVFESVIMGIPVVAARFGGIEDYLRENSIVFYEPENEDDFVETIVTLHGDPDARWRMIQSAREDLEEHRWENESLKLVRLVNGLYHD